MDSQDKKEQSVEDLVNEVDTELDSLLTEYPTLAQSTEENKLVIANLEQQHEIEALSESFEQLKTQLTQEREETARLREEKTRLAATVAHLSEAAVRAYLGPIEDFNSRHDDTIEPLSVLNADTLEKKAEGRELAADAAADALFEELLHASSSQYVLTDQLQEKITTLEHKIVELEKTKDQRAAENQVLMLTQAETEAKLADSEARLQSILKEIRNNNQKTLEQVITILQPPKLGKTQNPVKQQMINLLIHQLNNEMKTDENLLKSEKDFKTSIASSITTFMNTDEHKNLVRHKWSIWDLFQKISVVLSGQPDLFSTKKPAAWTLQEREKVACKTTTEETIIEAMHVVDESSAPNKGQAG